MLRGRPLLAVSTAFGTLYFAYVLWASFAKTLGPPPVKLGEVGEFWLFFLAVLAFAAQVFVEEKRSGRGGDRP